MPSTGLRASTAWTGDQDQVLMSARARGHNWVVIQKNHFHDKTPNACRKRHERLMERKNVDEWDGHKFERVAKEYLALRKEIWGPLAARVGEKWQVIESKCLEKGLKNIQAAARTATRREQLACGGPNGELRDIYATGPSTNGQDNGETGLEGLDDFSFPVPDDSGISSLGNETSLGASSSFLRGQVNPGAD